MQAMLGVLDKNCYTRLQKL